MGQPPQKIHLKLSPQAEKYTRQDAPREARLMAARGALPLQPVELAAVLFALMHDSDAEVKSTARDSLDGLPASVLSSVLNGSTHPPVLSHFAETFKDNEAHLEAIALNSATDDRTFSILAACPFKKIVEIASNNQERLLRCPAIVDALGDNPLTGRSTIDRILSFLGMDPDSEDDPLEPTVDPESIGDEEARAALLAVLGEDFSQHSSLLLQDNEEETAGGGLYNLIQNMSVFQRIKLGRMGNKEARGILIRDRNKIVAIAAVTSPKITDSELIVTAQARNVCDEVIRIVANNRDVTRNYRVQLALSTNPKTPLPIALKFVNYLQEKDLRGLMKSRDVPGPVSLHARRILTKKGKL